MDPVSLGLSVLATIDLCLKYGGKLVECCRTYRNAESVLYERALRVEVCWERTRAQIKYVRDAHQDFDSELTDLQSRLFEVLETKLKTVQRKFDKLHTDQLKIKKFRLVTAKTCLDEAIAELEDWQALFDPSWVVILKIASRTQEKVEGQAISVANIPKVDIKAVDCMRQIDKDTSKSLFFQHDPLALAKKTHIPHSSIELAYDSRDGKSYVIESIECATGGNVNVLAKDVRAIGIRLQSVDPARFGMLQCKGVIRKVKDEVLISFDLVLRLPKGVGDQPESFRSLLGTSLAHSLTERLRIAQQLARAVCYVHTLDFVHKNIRPESILCFDRSECGLGSLFLVGFQRFRAADGRTRLHEMSSWDANIYRHPHRQGEHPEEAYIMQHDMYSLGVCLLEIGLWSSFVEYADDGETPTPGSILGVEESFFRAPKAVKEKLVLMGKDVLPSKMGNRYSSVVVDCLTCLDPDNLHFADHTEFEDSDGILIGVKYITKILLELEGISL